MFVKVLFNFNIYIPDNSVKNLIFFRDLSLEEKYKF